MGVNLNLTMLPAKLKTAGYSTHQIGLSKSKFVSPRKQAQMKLFALSHDPMQANGTLASTPLPICPSTADSTRRMGERRCDGPFTLFANS